MGGWRVYALCVAVVALAGHPVAAGVRPEEHTVTAAGQLLIEGNDIRILGDVHGNGNVILSGTVQVSGAAEAAGQVVLLGSARAARIVGGVRHAGVSRIDFPALRGQASRILVGDHAIRGPLLLQGVTYVIGSMTVDGPVGGSGLLVAEGDITVNNGLGRNLGTGILGEVSLLAGRRVTIAAGGGTLAARLVGLQAVSITGRALRITGRIEGGDVFVRGNRITIAGPGTGVGLPPPVGQPTLRIHAPGPGELVRTGRILVVGQGPPGARIRLTLRPTEGGREHQVDTTAGADGRFSAFLDVPGGPGTYLLQAQIVGPGVVLSAPVEVLIRVQDMP